LWIGEEGGRMTTKEIEKLLNLLKKDKEQKYNEYIQPINDEIIKLEKARIENIIKNKEYIFDLSQYNYKTLKRFTALNSNGKEVYLPTDEIVEVNNGKLCISSYQGGVVEWSDEKNCYVHFYHYFKTDLDIIGFIDIEVEE
jgi:hypothetical protein